MMLISRKLCSKMFVLSGGIGRRHFSTTLLERYEARALQGELKDDPKQRKLVGLLDKLKVAVSKFPFHEFDTEQSTDSPEGDRPQPSPRPRLRGLYIHGSVGAGKTMLMDLFHDHCDINRKRRVHFHQFMLDVHRRIHQHKQSLLETHGKSRHILLDKNHDSIAFVAKEISKEAKVLCFDEFQVTDICDAVIITRLFNELWTHGTVMIATSNRAPCDLYKNGLNRHDFLPFIDRLEKECMVRSLDNDMDYRVLKTSSASFIPYYTPISKDTFQALCKRYIQDLDDWKAGAPLVSDQESPSLPSHPQPSIVLPLANRKIKLIMADLVHGFCLVDFNTLCKEDRGASDYYALAKQFHSIYLYGVSVQNKLGHNSARRFITLIDEFYNAHVRLVWVADANPHDLFVNEALEQQGEGLEEEEGGDRGEVDEQAVQKFQRSYQQREVNLKVKEEKQSFGQQEELSVVVGELASVQELDFAFRRAASRLTEMGSAEYLARWVALRGRA